VARAAGNIAAGVNRPELALFQARREQHTTRLDLSRARNRPRASLFVQGGYGRPGLNMLSNDFSAYSVGGIRLSWSLDNLYTYRNERRLVAASREEEDVREEAFLLNLSLEAARERGEVERWRALLVQDDEIVTLLERVAASAGRQVQEGTASVLEWTREVNRLDQARQARALHEMQWLLAIYTSLQITGE
jgi:outer membrane protein TolC